jgi:FKBP12-rapamycin complex-associated protein
VLRAAHTRGPPSQVRDALPWLNPRLEPSEGRRYAAVLILRELADCAPAVFNVHVKAFIDGVWGGLRDPKLHVRDASVQALQVGRPRGQGGGVVLGVGSHG